MADPTPAAVRPVLASDADAGRLEPVRIGVRCARELASTGALAPECDGQFAADDLSPGVRRLGDLELRIERRDHDDATTVHWQVRNAGAEPIRLESALLGVRWHGPPAGALRYLRHGWQSWSFTGGRPLDAEGTPPFPSGEWLRGMHHAVGRPPEDRAGWHESDAVTVVGRGDRGPVCLAGVLETGLGFGSVYLRRDADAVAIEVEVRLEVVLAPGEERRLEDVRLALGGDANLLLERFAGLWGRTAGARTGARFQAGWCSWYHFFHDVTEDDLLRNLDALAREREAFPVEVVQLDDGYQRAIGDWLETNAKFPRGLEPIARAIRDAGFTAGLWTAPFCAVTESRIHEDHRGWLLRDGDELFNALLHPEWSPHVRVFGLDTTRPDVIAHLESTFGALSDMGFEYLKLDFLHAAAMRADAADPGVTRAARLRRGLEAVRRGAGDDAFLLGCGCPLGPAVGVVDGMRIGPDVAPSWEAAPEVDIPGLEPALPSTRSALRSILHRAWMHRRLWLNDPDCLMVRTRDTALSPDEVRTLAASMAVTGGMLVFSDDVASVSQEGRDWLRDTVELAREVDAAGAAGTARVRGLLEPEGPELAVSAPGPSALVGQLRLGDEPGEAVAELVAEAGLAPEAAEVAPLLGASAPRVDGGRLSTALPAHASALYRLRDARPPVVFCDFDGTFSVQDVGATVARQRVGDRRPALWARFERGELDAWEYMHELFDGLHVPAEELDAFLRTIELDPGARDLVGFCEARGIPFRVLSDGFDYNLDRLQQIHDVAFEYAANHLRYEGELWRVAPLARNPRCHCGTGACKRGQIAAWREAHPGALCVHVGNGYVSDLCGALAADRVFAKDSLAPALDERGVAYEPFETLHDVIEGLETILDA